ncbi:site-specific integrase [Verrucosispora sp. WMMD1129]|uniref:tyrosine-type recombinase/integrase n=1 Tax=Verrucosispora sp. WMMD1129 TaxID=3016093 RepID=UPI00249A4D3B|nr:site-specific integrase [Verrucosispora sp. WMMD1129]WFE45014.1 tyrosine-type recombinase/integrase [Verrucosispora sp. WMMD1129]
MASVEKRDDGRPKPWLVRWRDEGGRQRKKSFARKVDADRFRAEVEHTLNTGSYIDPAAGKITFRQYAERWREGQPHRANTAARKKSLLTKHVYPVLGDRRMASIRTSMVQSFVTALPLAPSSARTVYRTVRAVFRAAAADRVIPFDPCVKIKLPELPHEEVVPLTIAQVDALAEAVPCRYRALVEFDAGTGLRQGEVFGVEVSMIDRARKVVKVYQQVQPAAGGGTVVCPLKAKASYRSVPLGDAMLAVLDAHMKEFPPVEVDVLDITGAKPVTRKASFVFADEAGRALNRNAFNETVWRRARAAAGLHAATQHDLRHFFASALIREGLSPKAVAALLGHADVAMTLNTYSHLWPGDDDRSRLAIDKAFRRDVPHMRPTPDN